MCAMDTREIALIRQSGLPDMISHSIFSVKYPVCVRLESGSFIGSNPGFLQSMKCKPDDYEKWFSHLALDAQVSFLSAEVNAFSACNGVSLINELCINNIIWDISVEILNVDNINFFVWRFFERNIFNDVRVNNKYLKFGISMQNSFWKIMPYLAGFSHVYSSRYMNISIDRSKKLSGKFMEFHNFSNRDQWLQYSMVSGEIFILYKKLTDYIKSHGL